MNNALGAYVATALDQQRVLIREKLKFVPKVV